MNSWEVLACYPWRFFDSLSESLSTKDSRITTADFRPCSICLSRSQASFCRYTLERVSNPIKPTFAHLRYTLGGDHPSQTTHHPMSLFLKKVRFPVNPEWYFTCDFFRRRYLPLILHKRDQVSMKGYSKEAQGLPV